MPDASYLKKVQQECQDLTLLYVEDDRVLSDATHKTLNSFFKSITLAYDGQEGLQKYQEQDFDMIITDIMMPIMDGKEMSRQIHQINPDQAIIVMSAHEEAKYLIELIEIGIYKFIQKPPNLKTLAKCILSTAIAINNAKRVAKLANETRQDLAESQELLRTIIDTVPVRIFWKDKDSKFLGCNKLFAMDAGCHSQEELIGKTDFDLAWKDQAQGYVDDDQEVMRSGKEKIAYEETQTQKNGKTIWLTTSKTPLLSPTKEIIGLLGSYVDVTKQKETMLEIQKARDDLGYQAEHDILTGLPNRTLYLDRLHQAIKQATRLKNKVGVVFIDLDRFKEINDTLGHETGDKVVQLLAKRLSEHLRRVDTIARFGGDEFILLVENLTNMSDLNEILHKLMKAMETPFQVEDHSLHLTLSAGVSIYPDDGDLPEILIRNADTAMYRAKDDGRNTYHFYTKEMTLESFTHLVMTKNIRKALENREFVVYYQPQIDGYSHKFIGMEALVRWISPEDGFISPAQFIPVAEDCGLIDKIGHYVFEEATAQIVQWYDEGYEPGHMSINLSPVELHQENFIQLLKDNMTRLHCKPQWLELEITEGYTMKNPDEAIRMLENIKALGISLAMDDFGTGYSSLSYLKKLPISKLKIDQAFVRELPDNAHDIAIVESIISMAKAMDFSVIAEGVETLSQHDFLIEKGCHKIQGYFYSKPMPADEMQAFLKNF